MTIGCYNHMPLGFFKTSAEKLPIEDGDSITIIGAYEHDEPYCYRHVVTLHGPRNLQED